MFGADALKWLNEPQDFEKGLGHGYWHYAFKDVMTMWSAITSFVHLREMGFHLQELISVEHKFLPDGQVAFRRESAQLVFSVEVHEFPFENYDV